jgi:hypothetical protein
LLHSPIHRRFCNHPNCFVLQRRYILTGYWRECRVERGGHQIILTLNVSPINSHSSCFLFFILLMLPCLSLTSWT